MIFNFSISRWYVIDQIKVEDSLNFEYPSGITIMSNMVESLSDNDKDKLYICINVEQCLETGKTHFGLNNKKDFVCEFRLDLSCKLHYSEHNKLSNKQGKREHNYLCISLVFGSIVILGFYGILIDIHITVIFTTFFFNIRYFKMIWFPEIDVRT